MLNKRGDRQRGEWQRYGNEVEMGIVVMRMYGDGSTAK